MQKAESDLSINKTSTVIEAKDKIINDLKTAIDEQENTMKVQDEVGLLLSSGLGRIITVFYHNFWLLTFKTLQELDLSIMLLISNQIKNAVAAFVSFMAFFYLVSSCG